jgi:hypothetical protein
MSISALPRRRPKNFSELWAEQRSSLPYTATKSTYHVGNPYPPGSADYYAYQAFTRSGGFASDHIWNELHPGYDAQDQKASERANAIANLDQSVHGLLQSMQPTRTETAMAAMDSAIRRLKAGY